MLSRWKALVKGSRPGCLKRISTTSGLLMSEGSEGSSLCRLCRSFSVTSFSCMRMDSCNCCSRCSFSSCCLLASACSWGCGYKSCQTINPLTPRRTLVSPFTKISILFSKISILSSKNFLWASRLQVGRRKEPILGYVPKNDEKKNLVHKGLKDQQ